MRASKGKRSKTLLKKYKLQLGVTEHTWGIRGNPLRGSGYRGKAKKWKEGASGKQNRDKNRPKEVVEDLVSEAVQ